jgi:hypothetical protein
VNGATFEGEVVWLTPEQGGRLSGPPTASEYRVTGFVPPSTIDNGLASFWLAGFKAGDWRSGATGWWPFAENVGPHEIGPGSVVVITEGTRTVAYFHVDEVQAADS